MVHTPVSFRSLASLFPFSILVPLFLASAGFHFSPVIFASAGLRFGVPLMQIYIFRPFEHTLGLSGDGQNEDFVTQEDHSMLGIKT